MFRHPSGERPGSPCWVELATPDVPAACAFYGALFGWEFHVERDLVALDGPYTVATREGAAVAGLYQTAEGQPTGWSLHLAVSDLAATTRTVEHLGGTVRSGPRDTLGRTTVAHAVDPCGAPFGFRRTAPVRVFGTSGPGMFHHACLSTHDGTVADEFYRTLFGYTCEQLRDDGIDHAAWRLGDERVLSRLVLGDEHVAATSPARWEIHFRADPLVDIDVLVAQVPGRGGRVLAAFDDTALLADPSWCLFRVDRHAAPCDV
ncbi:VOC family protein [Saccharomonospora xinjiangensis]|uniref:VOC family protein n=1 Tax=Saccharomonospora xinjiangensis TaxID=75294 RepID=UPI00350F09C4